MGNVKPWFGKRGSWKGAGRGRLVGCTLHRMAPTGDRRWILSVCGFVGCECSGRNAREKNCLGGSSSGHGNIDSWRRMGLDGFPLWTAWASLLTDSLTCFGLKINNPKWIRHNTSEVIRLYKRIRELREDHDLTQREVAEMLGMSQTGYSKYETGTNDIPTAILIKLADFYNVSVDYLLGRTNKTRRI